MRWMLVKDLQILRRSPLLVGLLIVYPIAIALMIGFALSSPPGKPTVAFYFRVPLDVAIKRIHDGRNGFKFYEAGMDLGLSENSDESFRLFQSRIIEEYEKIVPEHEVTAIDATLPIEEQQTLMRQLVKAKLSQAKRLRVAP